MDIVAMSGAELYQSVKGVADLDVVNNLPDVKNGMEHHLGSIDDGGSVTEKILQGHLEGDSIDIYA